MPFLLSARLRKVLALLALCAMCLGTVAPTVSRGLAATAQAPELLEICGGHGLTQARAPAQDSRDQRHGGDDGPSGPDGPGGSCCAYCTLSHHWPGAPIYSVVFAPHVPLPAARVAVADVVAPVLQAVHRPYMPQAPPRTLA